jgi:PPOX class probable F420-dependent enzyme
MSTINSSGTPQLTVMWYALVPGEDVIVLNATRGLRKERNLRRDPRMSLCIEDGTRYVTLEGRAELVDDRAQQEHEVNALIARATWVSASARRAGQSSTARTESASACALRRSTRAASSDGVRVR